MTTVPYQFPQTFDDGKIYIANDKIICEGNHGIYNCQVELSKLLYAYVLVDSNKQSFLFLFDGSQNQLPSIFRGFDEVYLELSAKFGFDDQVFFSNVHQQHELRQKLWRKKVSPTMKLLAERNQDYTTGFEVQSPIKEFVSWDQPYEDVVSSPNVIIDTEASGHQTISYQYPVRVGNIILSRFSSHFYKGRSDAPLRNFYSQCYDETNSYLSYHTIKEQFLTDFKSQYQFPGYEREDQNTFGVGADDINISITYHFDSDWHYEEGFTHLSITNNRAYPHLLIDELYEAQITISDFFVLEKIAVTVYDYKNNSRVNRRIALLNTVAQDASVIWLDLAQSKIGFADQEYSQVFDLSTIASFSIQNILPAKGGGGAYLDIIFNNGDSRYTVFTGACHAFDGIRKKLETLASIQVFMAPEQYDC